MGRLELEYKLISSSSLLCKYTFMKILFLDIDGVLNRFDLENISPRLESDLIDNLKRVVTETGCSVVISSSWKISSNLMDLLEDELIPKLPSGCVIGCTPTLIPQQNRENEIKLWLNNHQNEVDNWIVVDDYDFELQSIIEHCVITDALKGFTKENANECIRRLVT